MILEFLQDLADIIFSTGGQMEMALIKFSLWLLIFFTIFKGAEKVFKQSKAVPILVAAIISFIGIRFMPDEWFDNMMGVYAIVVGIALFLGPYILISILTDAARLGRSAKWVLVIIAYGALIYALPSFGVLDFGSGVLDSLMRYFADNTIMAAAAFIAVLIVLIMLRRKVAGTAGGGGRIRGFFGGVGRSAGRGAGYIAGGVATGAAAGASVGKAWFKRRIDMAKARREAMAELRKEARRR
jgi:uncharacterized membrane protein YgcG